MHLDHGTPEIMLCGHVITETGSEEHIAEAIG
jgi:hypothetical protein